MQAGPHEHRVDTPPAFPENAMTPVSHGDQVVDHECMATIGEDRTGAGNGKRPHPPKIHGPRT